MQHDCKQTEIIQEMKIELAVAKSDITTVKVDISGIKTSISKLQWWLIGIMGTTILTLISTIIAILLKK